MDGKRLAQGLLHAQGENLRFVYALVMETNMLKLFLAKAQDVVDRDLDHFEQRIKKEMQKLEGQSDEQLRLKLFLYIQQQLKIAGAHYNIPAEIDYACEQIVKKTHALQFKQDKQYKLFVSNQSVTEASSLLVLYQMQKMFEQFDEKMGDLSDAEFDTLIEKIDTFIQSLPKEKQRQIKERLQIDELTDATVKKLLATQGTTVLFAVLVEVAGFAAFTTLTSLMASVFGLFGVTLSFGTYVMATSVFSVLTGPIGLALIALGGVYLVKNQQDKLRQAMIPIAVVQLLLPAVMEEEPVRYELFMQEWGKCYKKQQRLQQTIQSYEKMIVQKEQQQTQAEQEVLALASRVEQTELERRQQLYLLQVQLLAHEKTARYEQLTVEIAQLEQQIAAKKQLIFRQKKQPSLMNRIKSTWTNRGLEQEVVKLKEQLAQQEQQRVQEMVQMKPAEVRAICLEVERLQRELAALVEQKQREQRLIFTLQDALINDKKLKAAAQSDLQAHQKQWYGLHDIESRDLDD